MVGACSTYVDFARACPRSLRKGGLLSHPGRRFQDAERCAFVPPAGKVLDFEELPDNPVIIRGDFGQADIIGIRRRIPGVNRVLDPRIEQGASADEAIVNGVLTLRRRRDGTW